MMIQEECWLELAEVTNEAVTDSSFQHAIRRQDTAIYLFHPGNSLASVVLQASILPPVSKQEQRNNEDDTNDGIDDTSPIHLRMHPVLFFFLNHASHLANSTAEESKNEEEMLSQSLATIGVSSDSSIHAEIDPLPMLEFQSIREVATQDRTNKSQWKCRPVKVGKLRKGSEIFLSCVYIESDESLQTKSRNAIPLGQVLGMALEGRIVKAGAILMLSTMYGYVIVSITNIFDGQNANNQQTSRETYRLSDDVLGDYTCHIETPTLSGQTNQVGIDEERMWEQEIPGYESSLQQIVDIFGHHGDPSGATGVVLSGCAGVGKTRLASCVAGHLCQTSIDKGLKEPKVYFSSVQDFIFQASVETNLLENILVPKLKGCKLWVIDDLNLLEIDAGSGDEVRNNSEIIMVQNALVEAMDRFHLQCCILGIAQSDTNLPSMLTKSGRLEKSVQILPPTQLQRTKIWKYILTSDDSSSPLLNDDDAANDDWVPTLASSTAGCVPNDLLRIYRYAQQRLRLSRDNHSVMAWEDLREAIKSTTPSQLSELDVIRPTIFSDLNWKEIHAKSWENFGGYPALKQSVYRQVVVPWRIFLNSMNESNIAEKEKEKSWLEPPPGVLFHGISGTGKTVAAKCLAHSLGLPTIQVRATDLLDKWLGGSESLLRSLFARARTVSPCILFLDEIDAIACNREEDDSNDLSSRILSTLLNEMDGVSSAIKASRVLVIACTNRIQSIDSALIRPGRLQEHFHMENPDVSSLEEILKLRMGKIPMGPDLDLAKLAWKLFEIKATGADVEGLCREAAFVAMRRLEQDENTSVSVSHEDFEFAISDRFR